MKIVLVHGWGFDRHFWKKTARILGSGVIVPDLGFFGPPDLTIPTGEPLTLVGHSLGLLRLLSMPDDLLPEGSLFLGINGFTRFARAPDFPSGIAPRVLDRMMAALQRDPDTAVRQFHASCGLTDPRPSTEEPELPTGTPVPERLRDGLMMLRNGDARLSRRRISAVLAGRDDPVVTPAMTEACFPRDLVCWSETGGHLLPLTHPDLCARFIRTVMEQHNDAA